MAMDMKIDTQIEINGEVFAFVGNGEFEVGDDCNEVLFFEGYIENMENGQEVEMTPELFKALNAHYENCEYVYARYQWWMAS